VFTTTSTANVGVSASVTYLDVGLKLDVEPEVHLQDDVAMKVSLEVSSVVKEISGPSGSTAYQIGTRSAATTLRLKNGETQILAGLISNEERNSANKLPGLGDLPLVGRLFASNKDSSSKTEIVLLITPRILRSLTPPQTSEPAWAAGTELTVGAPALRLSPTAPRSLGLSARPGAVLGGSGGAAGRAMPGIEPPEPVPAPVTENPPDPAPMLPEGVPPPFMPLAPGSEPGRPGAVPERPGELRPQPQPQPPPQQ
jgi:general secretion pathway protein D